MPTASDRVEVHYQGTLIDGTVFDLSVDRGETVTFPVNGVIPGWVEGLQLMSEGDKAEFRDPSSAGLWPRRRRQHPALLDPGLRGGVG